jgi:hypothetical protein
LILPAFSLFFLEKNTARYSIGALVDDDDDGGGGCGVVCDHTREESEGKEKVICLCQNLNVVSLSNCQITFSSQFNFTLQSTKNQH